FLERQIREPPDFIQQRAGSFREVQAPGAPVAWIGASLEPAIPLHAVENAHHRHRLDLGELREPGLAHAFVLVEPDQDLALRQRQRYLARATLEAVDVAPADVPEQKAEIAPPVHRRSGSSINQYDHLRDDITVMVIWSGPRLTL